MKTFEVVIKNTVERSHMFKVEASDFEDAETKALYEEEYHDWSMDPTSYPESGIKLVSIAVVLPSEAEMRGADWPMACPK